MSQLNFQGGVDTLYSVLAEHVRPPALLDFWHFSSVLSLIILEDPVRAQPSSWSKDSWGSPMSPPHPHQCNFLLVGALQIPVFAPNSVCLLKLVETTVPNFSFSFPHFGWGVVIRLSPGDFWSSPGEFPLSHGLWSRAALFSVPRTAAS